MTLVTTKGSWTCVAVQDTQFSLRGSDNFLWVAGDMNYGSAGTTGGTFLMRFSHLAKTSVRHLFLTARNGSRAILVEGPALADRADSTSATASSRASTSTTRPPAPSSSSVAAGSPSPTRR